MEDQRRRKLNRADRYFVIWTVMFSVTVLIGGIVLEPFPIPYLGITAASPLVVLMVTLNKLVIRRKFCVTAMYTVVSVLAIFTSYMGPPSILKPLFILTGLAFDAGSLFRTRNIKLRNLIVGHLALTIVGFTTFWVVFSVHTPHLSRVIGMALLVGAPGFFALAVIASWVTFKAIKIDNPPLFLKRVWGQLGVID